MNFSNTTRKGANTTTIGLVVVLVIVVVGAGAYIALNPGGKTTTSTSTSVSTQVSTSISTSVSTVTREYCTCAAASILFAGSTLVAPLMSIWSFSFSQVQPNVQVTYDSIGSGGGIAQITAGTVNGGASDAPLTTAQYSGLPSGSTLVTIPESASAVVPAYNLPGIFAAGASPQIHLNFTGNVLAEIFYGTITKWNDPRIAALQSPSIAAQLPNHALTVIHRSDGSGTMYAFTNYLSDSNKTWATKVGFATSVAWPVGIGCKGNEGVAGCTANTEYSISPLEISYVIANPGSINYGGVQNHAGTYIVANLTNIAETLGIGVKAGVPAGSASWVGYSIINNIYNDSSDKYVYPITTFTYLMLYQNLGASYAGTTQAQAVATVNFINWVLTAGQSAGLKLGYPALPSSVVAVDETSLHAINYNGTPLLSGS